MFRLSFQKEHIHVMKTDENCGEMTDLIFLFELFLMRCFVTGVTYIISGGESSYKTIIHLL